jgi:ankyrin repeat domain-containing protein 50
MWRSEKRSAVLWLTGEAGCGKTVLTNFLVQELKADTLSESRNVVNDDVVCCFFCARDVEAQKDARTLLRDLILQILASKKELIHHMKKTYGSTEHKYDPSFETLWRMFEMAVELVPCKHLYIVIDALDECEEKSKSKLLSKFSSSLPLQVKSGSARRKNVKFIISGLPHVRVAWKTSTVFPSHFHIKIEERPQGMVDDVKLFIDDRVDDLVINSICSKSSGEKLKTELHKLAENSFLWLSVVLNHIKNSLSYRDADLQRLLADIPPRLIIDAYTKYIPSLAISEIPRLRGYLQLITACARPLRLSEVDAFTELSNNPTASVLTSENETVIAGSLRRALGPLVKFPDSSVQLIHSTVKDYFTGLGFDTRHPLHQSHGIDADSAHLFCARACMRYLAHDDIPSELFDREQSNLGSCSPSPISVRRSPPSTNESGIFADLFDIQDVEFLQDERTFLDNANADVRARYQAYDYAASHWAYHFAESENLADESVMQEAITLLSTHLVRSSNWYKYKVHQSSIAMPSITEADALTLAAFFNHVRTLHTLLLREPSNQPRPNLQSTLYWAASRGQDESLKVLLEHGVRPIDPEYGQSALAIAIQGGFTDTCNILLEAGGANPNHFNRESRPPLVLAASYNHCEILHMLLQHSGIQVNQADGAGHTALIEACRFGSIECIQEILKDGRSDVNAVDRLGRGALIHASISEKDQIVRSLLANSHLEQNLQDNYGRNAMSYAATHCQLTTVKRLFRANVFIEARDLTGRNAISWAADSTKALEDGDEDQPCVLEYLVKKCPEATDVPDRSGWAPLAWATEGPGYLRSIQILLEVGRAEVNQKDQTSGRPILAWLASKNLAAAIEYLLKTRNIDKNATDDEGRTPLSYAAGNGSLESVRVLLNDKEVVINQCDYNGRTPMDWATLNYYDSTVQLLSEHRRRD